jgi:hypothetical protein
MPPKAPNASTPRRKSSPLCRKRFQDFLRRGCTSKLLILVQLIGGKFASAHAARECELASGCTSLAPDWRAAALLGLIASAVVFGAPHAAMASMADKRVTIKREITADRTVINTVHTEYTLLSPRAALSYSQAHISFSRTDTLDVLEAFTRKPDGRIAPADPSEFSTQDGAVNATTSFVDAKIRKVPFRDASVGDTVVITYRLTQTGQPIPGHVSHIDYAPPSNDRTVMDVTVRAPSSITLRHDEKQFVHTQSADGDMIEHHWTGTIEPSPAAGETVADNAQIPHIAYSDFATYEDLARSVNAIFAGRLTVTPAVQKLADEITEGVAEPRAQARAIFDWFAKNMRYQAIIAGRSWITPNDPDTVLARRFGNCLDHAALMKLLLAAKGVESEYALISIHNRGPLIETPVAASFDHIIVYIPSLDLYADPTAPFSILGGLPEYDMDKPALRFSATQASVGTTPAGTPDDQVVKISSAITLTGIPNTGIPKTGTFEVRGKTSIEGRGVFAQTLRGWAAEIEASGQALAASKLADQVSWSGGRHTLSGPASTDHSEPYTLHSVWDYTLKSQGVLMEKGWRPPVGLTPVWADPKTFFGKRSKFNGVTSCQPGRIIQDVAIELPKGMTPRIPASFDAEAPRMSIHRRWLFEGRTFTIHTEMVSTVARRVCSPTQQKEFNLEYGKIAEKAFPLIRFDFVPASGAN